MTETRAFEKIGVTLGGDDTILARRWEANVQIPGHDLKAGWGVLRLNLWHLAGVFTSSGDAEKLVRTMGAGYVVRYGDHRVGSQDFSFTSTSNS